MSIFFLCWLLAIVGAAVVAGVAAARGVEDWDMIPMLGVAAPLLVPAFLVALPGILAYRIARAR